MQIPAWPATRGVPAGTPFFSYPEDIAMTKPFLTFQAQISFLEQDKNLLVENRTFAEAMLTQIGYFSLIGGLVAVDAVFIALIALDKIKVKEKEVKVSANKSDEEEF